MTHLHEGDVVPQLGPALRRHRKAAGLTMNELASRCGLSQPFLSQIENSRAMPSLLALHRVAQALETTTQALLEPVAPPDTSVVRSAEGERFAVADGATVRFLIPGGGHRLEANEVVAAANVEMDHVITHGGEEVVHVLAGSIVVELEATDDLYLEQGDTATYAATTPHRWRSGSTGARFLIITSPPSF